MRRVAVVITTYNCPELFEHALASVLAQDFADMEVAVVDDGSATNECAAIVRKAQKWSAVPLHYIYQKNQGPSAARNRGIEETESEFVAFLDGDDLYEPYKISLQTRLLSSLSHDFALVLGGASSFFHDNLRKTGQWIPPVVDGFVHREVVEGTLALKAINGGALFRRAALDAVGRYDTELRNNEDFDLLIRLSTNHKIRTHPEIVHRIRIRPDSISNGDPMKSLEHCLKFIDKLQRAEPSLPAWKLDRRRQRAYFAAARVFLERRDFGSYSALIRTGVSLYGRPGTLRGWLAYLLALGLNQRRKPEPAVKTSA